MDQLFLLAKCLRVTSARSGQIMIWYYQILGLIRGKVNTATIYTESFKLIKSLQPHMVLLYLSLIYQVGTPGFISYFIIILSFIYEQILVNVTHFYVFVYIDFYFTFVKKIKVVFHFWKVVFHLPKNWGCLPSNLV